MGFSVFEDADGDGGKEGKMHQPLLT